MTTVKAVLMWAAVVFVLFVAFSVWHFTVTDEWKKRGLYVWRVRKAWALFNFPIMCRHFGYVGMTGNRTLRDRQHRFGTQYEPPAPWSDLNPRPYPLPCYFPGWEFARKVQEKLWIFLLLPVYNVHWNTANPRRIGRRLAYDLKAQRQSGGRRFNLGYKIVRSPAALLAYGLMYLAVLHWIA